MVGSAADSVWKSMTMLNISEDVKMRVCNYMVSTQTQEPDRVESPAFDRHSAVCLC